MDVLELTHGITVTATYFLARPQVKLVTATLPSKLSVVGPTCDALKRTEAVSPVDPQGSPVQHLATYCTGYCSDIGSGILTASSVIPGRQWLFYSLTAREVVESVRA
jgi:hypothetical protein